MHKAEIAKLQAFLRRSFGNDGLRVAPDPKDPDNAANVTLGERKIATITLDDEDGDRSFAFAMKIPVGRETLQEYLRKLFENEKLKLVARGKKTEDIDKIARGRVWSGAQALERGLVDQLGGLRDAVADAASRAKLGTEFQLRYVERPPGAFDRFLLSLSESAMAHVAGQFDFGVAQSLLARDADLRRPLRMLQNLNAGKPTVFAYCFCEVR